MRILQVHNFYRQAGGEDTVVRNEAALLRENGHIVVQYMRSNEELGGVPGMTAAKQSVWSGKTFSEVSELIAAEQPDVLHAHNTFPLISPSVYYAASAARVPVVQTIHNFRLACPNALLYRDGARCHDCVGKSVKWPAVVHACYRGSRAASLAVTSTLAVHRLLGTWRHMVSCYIALTEFARDILVREGLPADRIRVKPNFVFRDTGIGVGDGQFILFVGRLTEEKGVRTLLDTWRQFNWLPELRLVGVGPLFDEAVSAAAVDSRIVVLGGRSHDETLQLMGDAPILVFPSTWYEGMPMTIVEALARGTPVAASDLGGAREMLTAARHSKLFAPGNPESLASVLTAMWNSVDKTAARTEARDLFERHYTASANYSQLVEIYRTCLSVA